MFGYCNLCNNRATTPAWSLSLSLQSVPRCKKEALCLEEEELMFWCSLVGADRPPKQALPVTIACLEQEDLVFGVLLLLLLLLFLTFSALVANPKKTTLHGGQSRSWSAEQGKKKKKSLAAHPPPPPPPARCSFGEKIKKLENKKLENHAAHPHV